MDTQSYLPVEPGVGMEENFLSLDDILLSHERLPIRTECRFPRLGYLEKSADAQDIPEGTKMELPLWLSKGLYEKKRRVLSVELPKVYREGWRTVFNADPNVVDLHKMGPYYYGLGSQMLHFDSPENPELAQTLLQLPPPGRLSLEHFLQQHQLLVAVAGLVCFFLLQTIDVVSAFKNQSTSTGTGGSCPSSCEMSWPVDTDIQDVRGSLQEEHGLLPERLQRGHVCAGGAAGLPGEGSVHGRAEWPQRLPELGEGPSLPAHRLQPRPQLPQEEDGRRVALSRPRF